MIERPGDDDLEAVVRGGVERELFFRDFRERVGTGRPERRVFGERFRLGAVDHAGRHDEDAASRRVALDGVQQMVRAAHVDLERLGRPLPGIADVAMVAFCSAVPPLTPR